MVEHVLIRIADLREEAAAEEWQRLHPRSAALRRRLHYLRCRAKLVCIRLRETAFAQRVHAAGMRQHACLRESARAIALSCLRLLRLAPPRRLVRALTVRQLKAELDARGLGAEACVERGDLLDLLCGPPAPPGRSEGAAARWERGDVV